MEATLVYPHQLYQQHPAVEQGRRIYLVEDPLFFGNDPEWPAAMHQQKLVLHRASMKAFTTELEKVGHQVFYLDCPNGNKTSSDQLLDESLPKSIRTLHLCDPSDDVLLKRIEKFATKRKIELTIHSSPNFLSPPEFIQKHIGDRKIPFMASFYQEQRKRMNLLMDGDNPQGGKWSFDEDNRKKLPKNHQVPNEPQQAHNDYVTEAIRYVESTFGDRPGRVDSFRWPVTRMASKQWLKEFITDRLEHFGAYEDAISTQHRTIYHSAITPMLNIGLLDPQEVVDEVMAQADSAPINSVEGFIRQVIGWREFMHGIYRHRGRKIRSTNFWKFDREIPKAFYDGTTGIPPIDRVIHQLLGDAYCHHIERLMILGNFMVLCRIHPDDVYRWFMEMFIDSYDWVMVPNVYGMSQFADGGTFTTKPYISGSNYVLKMSDEKKGDWCKIWDGLFWSFIGDHQDFFLKNPRLSMMARNWSKQSEEKQSAHRKAANDFLSQLQ